MFHAMKQGYVLGNGIRLLYGYALWALWQNLKKQDIDTATICCFNNMPIPFFGTVPCIKLKPKAKDNSFSSQNVET